MASGQSNLPPGLVEEFEQNLAAQQIQVAMLALTVFDFILCLPREIDLLWRQKLRLGSWLYFLIRYCFLVFMFMSVFIVPSESASCDALVKVASAIDLVSAVAGAGFATTRAWALYDRKSWILIFYLVLYIPWFCMSMKILVTTTCGPASESLASLTQLLLAFMNAISLVLNLFIVVLTVNRTYRAVSTLVGLKSPASGDGVKGSESSASGASIASTLAGADKQTLLGLLLIDGSIYFAVMFVADIVTVVMAYRAPAPLQSVGASVGAVFAVNLVCRFLLDLRQAIDPSNIHVVTLGPRSGASSDSSNSVIDISEKNSPLSAYTYTYPSPLARNGNGYDDGEGERGSVLWIRDLGAFPDYRSALLLSRGGRGGGPPPAYYSPSSYAGSPFDDREKALPPIPLLTPSATPAPVPVLLSTAAPGTQPQFRMPATAQAREVVRLGVPTPPTRTLAPPHSARSPASGDPGSSSWRSEGWSNRASYASDSSESFTGGRSDSHSDTGSAGEYGSASGLV